MPAGYEERSWSATAGTDCWGEVGAPKRAMERCLEKNESRNLCHKKTYQFRCHKKTYQQCYDEKPYQKCYDEKPYQKCYDEKPYQIRWSASCKSHCISTTGSVGHLSTMSAYSTPQKSDSQTKKEYAPRTTESYALAFRRRPGELGPLTKALYVWWMKYSGCKLSSTDCLLPEDIIIDMITDYLISVT